MAQGCWHEALEIMLDGIGKDLCLSLAILLSVLLTAKYDGLCAVDLVDAVNDGIQSAHLLKLFGNRVKQVLLNGTVVLISATA